MDLQIEGKTALVTGGTRGIGRAIVETFVAEGTNVGFCARTPDEVAATEAELTDTKVVGTVMDVRDGDAMSAWVEGSAEEFGGIDMVVSNVSALAIPDTDQNWVESVEVDLMGTVRLVKAAIPHLKKSTAPSIVAISSVSGREVDFASGPYGTIKTALVGYISGVAFDLAEEGIRANIVSPGNTYFEDGVWAGIEQDNPDLFEFATGLNPTGRMGTPEEVAS
ncbi:MAG: SDR family NAD(P)-dependent oxidoreductase, partial [Acidimicrobiia bacterium]|nr:SDR family NAD(P)-dependent oxidoreductase [Acidimicrobiia bacterium]